MAGETNTENTPEPEINHEGIQCWGKCNRKQGPCSWCGTKGMCCRKNWKGNGCDGSIGGRRRHECTKKPEAGKIFILSILHYISF